MDNYITQILNDKEIMRFIFNSSELYQGSEWEGDFSKNISSLNFKNQYLINNTDWLFLDNNNNCYGLLDKYVIFYDDEGDYHYLCNFFENIAECFLLDEDLVNNRKKNALKQSVNYNSILARYYKILNQNEIKPTKEIDEADFQKYLAINLQKLK